MRSHSFGHHSSVDDTLAGLAPTVPSPTPPTPPASAWGDNQGPFGVIAGTPAWSAFLLVDDFSVTTSKTATAITSIWTNPSGANATILVGVAAVPTGDPAPTTPDYAFAATKPTVVSHEQLTYPLNVMYGAGGDAPAALAPGAYDFYLMAQASASLAIAPSAMQMEVRNA